jgi:NADPH-dependent 2,4-dienoyl-CoA reductase/sulfur reductase-like enzyme
VVIIGAGPAGLEAARVLALRKFKPIIFEKTNKLGGQLELANKPPKKDKINWLLQYLKNQVEKLAVEIRFNTIPTLEMLNELNPYAIFIAHGSKPVMPRFIPGIDGEKVANCVDILEGKVKLIKEKVAVIGSGRTGLETAHFLAEQGNEVSLFEMADTIGPQIFFQNRIDLLSQLGKLGVKLYPKHKLVKLENGTAFFTKAESGETSEYSFDAVAISVGAEPNQELTEEIQGHFQRVYVLGDAQKVGRIRNALEAGFITASALE